MSTTVAAHFLAGSIISWAMPIGLLALVILYWTLLLRRRSHGERSGRTD